MRTIKNGFLRRLTCLGLFTAVAVLGPTPAQAQRGGHAGVARGGHAPSSASTPHSSGRWYIVGGGYWYPGYQYGYVYTSTYPAAGFSPGFADPYGVFGGSAPFRGFADPYGVFGGPSVFDYLVP
jgi:hypothetical protein